MKKLKKTLYNYRYEISLYFIFILIHYFMHWSLKASPVSAGDSFFTLASGAFLGGFEWSDLTATGAYYGFGYTMLLTPILKIFHDPVTVYKLILLANGAITAVSCVLAYRILYKYYDVKNQLLCALISFASVFLHSQFALSSSVINDVMLSVLVWVLLYLLTACFYHINNRKRVAVYTAGLIFVLSYAFTIHTRALFLIGAVIVAVIGCLIYYRKSLVNIPFLISGILLGSFITNKIIDYLLRTLWLFDTSSQNELPNTMGEITNGYGNLFLFLNSISDFLVTIYSIIGRIFSTFASSAGITGIGIIVCIYILLVMKNPVGSKAPDSQSFWFDNLRIGNLFVLSGYVASVVVISFGATKDLIQLDRSTGVSKWLIYLRYQAPFIGPIVLILFAFLYHKEVSTVIKKRLLKLSLAFYALIIAGFAWKVARYLIGINVLQSGEMKVFLPFARLSSGDVYSKTNIAVIILTLSICFIVSLCLLYKEHLKTCLLFLILVTFYTNMYVILTVHLPQADGNYNMIDQTYAAIDSVDKENLPDQLYAFCLRRMYALNMQTALKDTPVVAVDLDDIIEKVKNEDEFILMSDCLISEDDGEIFVLDNLYYAQLDDNEYLYISGTPCLELFPDIEFTATSAYEE